jgi:acetylglutamate kinase
VSGPVVLKLGGDLVDGSPGLSVVASAVAAVSRTRSVPLVIVHGGGHEIDAALASAGLTPQRVDGVRITDAATLDVVVAVLAGSVNTRLVAALNAAGVPAVGLTGADAGCGLWEPAPPHRTSDGRAIDLGRVGVPAGAADMRLFSTLLDAGFVPVVATIGAARDGRLLNVNGDTFAGHLAARLRARRLVIAGTTPGVLDAEGATIPLLDAGAIARLLETRTATAGMVAKLRACEHALAGGVGDVVIVNGENREALESAAGGDIPVQATRAVGQRGRTVSPAGP